MKRLRIEVYQGSFHACRRAFAKNYLRRRGNLLCLKNILGHESVVTTQTYVEVELEALQEAHTEISVMEKSTLSNHFDRLDISSLLLFEQSYGTRMNLVPPPW